MNHFSYEDLGLLRLYTMLTLALGLLYVLLIKAFIKFFKLEKTWMAPHPVLIYGLSSQLFSIILMMVNLYLYSHDGEGSTLADVLSKVS